MGRTGQAGRRRSIARSIVLNLTATSSFASSMWFDAAAAVRSSEDRGGGMDDDSLTRALLPSTQPSRERLASGSRSSARLSMPTEETFVSLGGMGEGSPSPA